MRSFGIDVEGAGAGIEAPVPVAVAEVDPVGGDLAVVCAADATASALAVGCPSALPGGSMTSSTASKRLRLRMASQH